MDFRPLRHEILRSRCCGAPSDAACTPVLVTTERAGPPTDWFASTIAAANAVCFFPEPTKVPYVLEPLACLGS